MEQLTVSPSETADANSLYHGSATFYELFRDEIYGREKFEAVISDMLILKVYSNEMYTSILFYELFKLFAIDKQ